MSSTPGEGPRRFRASIGDRHIDLLLNGRDVSIEGRRKEISHRRLSDHQISLIIDGRSLPATVLREEDGRYRVLVRGQEFEVEIRTERDLLLERFGLADTSQSGAFELRAPMPGLVLSVAVDSGTAVQKGDRLLVLEAMKMENELRAAHEGIVKSVHVKPGDAVGKNALLLEIE